MLYKTTVRKRIHSSAGDTAHWLRVLTALAEALNSAASTYVWGLRTFCNSDHGGLEVSGHTGTYTHAHTPPQHALN